MRVCVSQPRMPGISAADYISTSSSLSLAHSFHKNASFMKLPMRTVVSLWLCDIIFWVIPATCCSCYKQCLGLECVIILGFPPDMYCGRYLHCSHGWYSSD